MSKRSTQSTMNTHHYATLVAYTWQRLREGLMILIIAAALFLILALSTYHASDPGWSHYTNNESIENSGGRFGAWLADLLLFLCGFWAYLLPLLLGYSAWLLYQHRQQQSSEILPIKLIITGFRVIGFLILTFAATGLITAYLANLGNWLPDHSGGIIGQIVISVLTRAFNFSGCVLILIASALIGVTLLTELSWLELCEAIGRAILRFTSNLFQMIRKFAGQLILPRSNQQPVVTSQKKSVFPRQRIEPQIPIFTETDELDEINTPTASRPARSKLTPKPLKQPAKPKVTQGHECLQSISTTSGSIIPELSLLNPKDTHQQEGASPQELEERSREVELRLADFGVNVQVVAAYPGPVVTRFEVQLAAGTKVSKISGLAKDLARSLSVVSVRVVEVIPGKSVIGIELPNPHREIVTLQEVLASKAYANSRSVLSLALGKDIAGHAVVVDLAKMPHLLVAGTTGAGKSVSLNAMLLSFLYKAAPQQLRMIMIDPKMLELSIYDGIPHLLTPVVTDMKDAATALRWCVAEMERRYRLMASLGVRNILGYNAKIHEAAMRNEPLFDQSQHSSNIEKKPLIELPHIVVLADEFADMMVVVGKKVETLIARLAQKARAAGIHLILATQRPSVDVITGLIKANIPTRIAFQVSSKIDSRTILDQQGAEQLLGHGDMLYLAPGTGVPVRVHGAFVSDEEVHRVVAYLKQQAQPEYIEDLLNEPSSTDGSGYTEAIMGEENFEEDPFYDEAVHMIAKSRRVSVSSIQRRFKIGYNRAARIVEAMEKAGIVSAMESNGSREVLAPAPID